MVRTLSEAVFTGDWFCVREVRGGTRGSKYIYVYDPCSGGLVHIGRISVFRLVKTLMLGGRRTEYRYCAGIRDLLEKYGGRLTLYSFYYTRKGYGPYSYRLVFDLVSKRIVESRKLESRELRGLVFDIVGPEKRLLEIYDELAPRLAGRIKQVGAGLGVMPMVLGHALRLEDALKDPRLGYINAMVQPSPQSRIRALKQYISSLYELYIFMLVLKALGAKILPRSWTREEIMWVEHASSIPTVIAASSCGGEYTVWYQFSPEKWLDVVVKGMLTKKRQHVKPDILVVKGHYESRDELFENPPGKTIVIDVKLAITQQDYEELAGYKQLFDKLGWNTSYIIASPVKIPPINKSRLTRLGYHVIDNLKPGTNEEKYVRLVRELLV